MSKSIIGNPNRLYRPASDAFKSWTLGLFLIFSLLSFFSPNLFFFLLLFINLPYYFSFFILQLSLLMTLYVRPVVILWFPPSADPNRGSAQAGGNTGKRTTCLCFPLHTFLNSETARTRKGREHIQLGSSIQRSSTYIIMKCFRFTRVFTCLSSLRSRAVQIPEHAAKEKT